MSISAAETTHITLDPALASRIVREGYGSGAWHGPDLRTAIDDVPATMAFRRPASGRHNIAEIVIHHAFYVRSVFERLGGTAEAFPLDGEDWFALNDESAMTWTEIKALLASLQARLVAQVGTPSSNGQTADERMNLVLGITCHAVYHAGQIQLVKAFVGQV